MLPFHVLSTPNSGCDPVLTALRTFAGWGMMLRKECVEAEDDDGLWLKALLALGSALILNEVAQQPFSHTYVTQICAHHSKHMIDNSTTDTQCRNRSYRCPASL
eukprot:8704096-Pyramimonas_sp.AAC.1